MLGIILVPVGIYMRSDIEEDARSTARQRRPPPDRRRPAGSSPPRLFRLHGSYGPFPHYVILYYMPTLSPRNMPGWGARHALWSNTIGLIILVVAIPAMGLLSDRIGRKPLLSSAAALLSRF